MIINRLPFLRASTGKSALLIATPMAFLRGDAFLELPIPKLLHPLAGQWDAGGRAPQAANRNKSNPDMYVPRLAKAR